MCLNFQLLEELFSQLPVSLQTLWVTDEAAIDAGLEQMH